MTAQPAPVHPRSADRIAARVTPRSNRPRLRPWIVFTVAVVVAFFGLIYSRISLDRSAFELDELETLIAEEEATLHDLRVEVARLQNPARIDALAREMGMIYPDSLVSLEVPGIEVEGLDPDVRWAQLKALLSAQP